VTRTAWWLLGATALGVGGLLMRKQDDEFSGPLYGPSNGGVAHRERAVGVDGRLLMFLDEWDAHGPFPIVVLPDGGIRDDAKQAALYASGRTAPGSVVTNARNASETPHGHAGALDVAPYIGGAVPWGRLDLFASIGQFAKARGLVWGGDWVTLKDYPHVEVPDWRSLPVAKRGVFV
jgi:hypothetical protein